MPVLFCEGLAAIEPVHEVQLLNYLRTCEVKAGLLLNSGPTRKVKPMVFANEKKKNLRSPAVICG